MIDGLEEAFRGIDLFEYRPLSEWAELSLLKRIGFSQNRMSTLGKIGFLHVVFDRSIGTNVTNLESLLNTLKARDEIIKAQTLGRAEIKDLINEFREL